MTPDADRSPRWEHSFRVMASRAPGRGGGAGRGADTGMRRGDMVALPEVSGDNVAPGGRADQAGHGRRPAPLPGHLLLEEGGSR
jgi:hypothetical protein